MNGVKWQDNSQIEHYANDKALLNALQEYGFTIDEIVTSSRHSEIVLPPSYWLRGYLLERVYLATTQRNTVSVSLEGHNLSLGGLDISMSDKSTEQLADDVVSAIYKMKQLIRHTTPV